ncbi:flavin reductase [Cryobacterium sp. TMS1-20-1]|uniref:flavin reductase family protein n=1 Tax=Cryobacterium sp. TMS1-20-1 TaxID=1259223 RepID=UPI00106C653E|nr:flavin reductase family protein [Cryobacterium sp. TMS1-20-1]TFC80560.1 flavin reductase [Cryobacterium sp. TMS1-20-1]
MNSTAIDPLDFRKVLGQWPSGVVVVTGMVDNEPIGMSCNSFSSVSLDPPLVGIFVASTSSTWPGIRDSGSFTINVLASHHEELSRNFSRRGVDRFRDVLWSRRPSGPALDEAVAWIECELFAELETGDHTLALGRVTAIEMQDGLEPLIFHRGQYSASGSGVLV